MASFITCLSFVVLTFSKVTTANNAGCDSVASIYTCGKAGACCDEHDRCIEEHCPTGCKAVNSWPGWPLFPWGDATPTAPVAGFPCSDPANGIWGDDDDFGECYLCQAQVADCIFVDCGDPGTPNCPNEPSECCNKDKNLEYCGKPQLCAHPESDIDNAHKPIYDPCKCKELYPDKGCICKCDDSDHGEGDYCDPFCPCEGDDLKCNHKGSFFKKPTFKCEKKPSSAPSSFPVSSPESSPILSPSYSPQYSPMGSPEASPSYSPQYSPMASPETSPSYSPQYSPMGSPETSPSYSPQYSPMGSPETSPSYSPQYSPMSSPEASPSYSPEYNSGETLAEQNYDGF